MENIVSIVLIVLRIIVASIIIGNIKKTTMGGFQITYKNDNEEYATSGSFNNSSKQKTASITIMLEYQST